MRGSADWVATFLECRTREKIPVENLSPRNNTVALALSGCVTPGNGSCTCPCLFVFRLLSLHALCNPLGTRPCPHYNGITCPHITLAVPARNTHFSPRFTTLPHTESYFFLLGYVRPGYILHPWFGVCAVFTEPRARGCCANTIEKLS